MHSPLSESGLGSFICTQFSLPYWLEGLLKDFKNDSLNSQQCEKIIITNHWPSAQALFEEFLTNTNLRIRKITRYKRLKLKTQWLTCPLRILGSPENFAQRSTKDARKKSYFRLRIAAQEKFSFLGQLAYLGFQYLVFQELFFSFWRRDRQDYKEPSNNKDQQQHGRFTLKTRAVEFILGTSLRSCWKKSMDSCTLYE